MWASSGVGRLVWRSESPVSLLDQSHVPKIEGACHLAPIAGMEWFASPSTETQRGAWSDNRRRLCLAWLCK